MRVSYGSQKVNSALTCTDTCKYYLWLNKLIAKQLVIMELVGQACVHVLCQAHESPVFVFLITSLIQGECSGLTSCPSANQQLSPRSLACYVRAGGCLAGVGGTGWGQDKKKSKSKRTKASLQRKRRKKQQSEQLSYIINLPPCWILAPRGLLTTPGRPDGVRNVCVCVFGVVLCPAAAGQNICWVQSSQVRDRGRDI